MMRLATLLLASVLTLGLARAAEDTSEAVSVTVSRSGDNLALTAEFRVPVNVRQAWDVLTDFEHMPAFVPGLRESHVLSQAGNRLTVEQKGESTVGLLPVEYESVRVVELNPYQSIRSRTIKGSLGNVEGVTRLTAEGRHLTLVQYSASVLADSSLAALVPSSYVKDGLKTQFQALRQEMLRRARLQLGKTAIVPGGG
jgi:carbon monoxide dehydrogenase subunit G